MITKEQIEKIRSVPITELLKKQGYSPVEGKHGRGVWYKAPWRDESEPSLKVCPELNVWFDYGAHVGGDCISLVQYHHNKGFPQACELIQSLMDGMVFDSTPIELPKYTRPKQETVSYAYLKEEAIHSASILRYLESRRISRKIADRYCVELHYGKTHNEHYYSLAFKTGEESYELRNSNFKGCIGPKCIAIIDNEYARSDELPKACIVFEGFFNMLTYVQLLQQRSPMCVTEYPCDMIVLNSAGFVPQAQPIFDQYDRIHCYLDNDKTGHEKTHEILDRNAGRAVDESYRYRCYNDLNDYLCGVMQEPLDDPPPPDI